MHLTLFVVHTDLQSLHYPMEKVTLHQMAPPAANIHLSHDYPQLNNNWKNHKTS